MSCAEPRRTGRRRLDGVPLLLWRSAATASRRLLMLDYDGTLAPFRVERYEARPSSRAVERLRAIAASPATTLAIVSGRPVRELDELLGSLHAALIGEHGWERKAPREDVVRHPLPAVAHAVLDDAARAAGARGWGDRLERKRASLVLHTRGLAPALAAELERECAILWRRTFERNDAFRVASTHSGIELHAPGRDKGAAVRELLAAMPGGAYPVYLGDDETDEDAFREVRGRGLGIRVGPRDRPSLAEGHLDSPRSVVSFLRAWLAVVERRRGA